MSAEDNCSKLFFLLVRTGINHSEFRSISSIKQCKQLKVTVASY